MGSTQEAIDRLRRELDRLVALESVGVMVKVTDLGALLASHAASAERIKALEGLLREIKPVAHLFQWNDLRDQIDALLKEADQ